MIHVEGSSGTCWLVPIVKVKSSMTARLGYERKSMCSQMLCFPAEEYFEG